jgi:thiopeptide-type bacteriocin biosynthesis protein
VDTGFHGIEHLITDAVPDAIALEGVDRWFFVRYIDDEGLHLRLRLQVRPPAMEAVGDAARAILTRGLASARDVPRGTYRPVILPPPEAIDAYLDSWRSAGERVVLDRYEPEVDKFGPDGVAIAEELFESSSAIALAMLQAERRACYQRKTLVPTLMRLAWDGFDGRDAAGFWRAYALHWLEGAARQRETWIRRFERKALALATRGVPLYLDASTAPAGAMAIAARWREAVAAAAAGFARLATAPAARDLAFHFIHLNSNRLGLMPIEEAYFATLIETYQRLGVSVR